MTVSTTSNKEIATGNGVATSFPFNFGTLPTPDLVVTLFDLNDVEIPQVEGVDYTVTGAGLEDGGAVVFTLPPTDNYTVLIQRIIPLTQPTDIKNQGSFFPRTVERAFGDRNVFIDQQQQERIDASMQLPPQVQGVSTILPVPEATTLVGWNDAANALQNFPLASIATSFVYGDKVWNKFAGTGAQVLFVLGEDAGSIGNLDISIDGVTQVPMDDYTLVNRNLTFAVAPSNGAVILVRFDKALPVGAADANSTSYTPPQTGVLTTVRLFLDALWASNGANLVRWLQTGTGSVFQTIQDELRRTIRPEHFGAVGNGVADDSAAIQRAVTAVYAQPWGGVLALTPGKTYAVGATVQFPKAVNKRMILQGNGAMITPATGFNGVLCYFGEPTNTISAPQMRIIDLVFNGPYLGPVRPALVQLQNANGICFERCSWFSGTTGVSQEESFAVSYKTCVFQYQSQYGISITSGAMNLIIDDCGFYDIVDSDLYFVQKTYNIAIRETDFEGGGKAMHFVAGISTCVIDGCYIEGKSSLPVFFGGASESLQFTNNWLGYNTGSQEWINLTNAVISNNIFWNQGSSVNANCASVAFGHNVWNGTSNQVYSAWAIPAFTNGFSNTGGAYQTAGYFAESDGTVRLRGMVQAAADNWAFQLPVGLRPGGTMVFASVAANGTPARITVASNGQVTCFRGTDGSADLSGVVFKAAG